MSQWSRAKILLAALLLSAQSLALAHDHQHAWADELCDVCVISQNLETCFEPSATIAVAWSICGSPDRKSDHACELAIPAAYQSRAPPLFT